MLQLNIANKGNVGTFVELFLFFLVALPIIPAGLHWVMLAFCPESPSWLYLVKKDKDASRKGEICTSVVTTQSSKVFGYCFIDIPGSFGQILKHIAGVLSYQWFVWLALQC